MDEARLERGVAAITIHEVGAQRGEVAAVGLEPQQARAGGPDLRDLGVERAGHRAAHDALDPAQPGARPGIGRRHRRQHDHLVEVERALGWDARAADVIVGTSAGSELAMLLGAGVAASTILAAALGEREAPAALRHRFAHPPPSFPPWPTARPAADRTSATWPRCR